MTAVYVWPVDVGGETDYSHPTRLRTTRGWTGAPGQQVEHIQRSTATLSGEVVRGLAPTFDIMLDRLDGGRNLIAIWDYELRAQNGWDLAPAINSSGAEFWRANGETAAYAGEAANPPTGPWRSVFALANGAGAVGDTTLAVDGLIDSETIPKGSWIRAGDYRYRTLAAVTANGSGEATISLAKPLLATVANDSNVRIPGDLFVGYLTASEFGAANVWGVRNFSLTLQEVYEAEIQALSTASPAVGFEWTVD